MIFETKIKTGKSFVSNIVTKNGTQTSVLPASKSITTVVKSRGLPGSTQKISKDVGNNLKLGLDGGLFSSPKLSSTRW